jgi:hypothetical protein
MEELQVFCPQSGECLLDKIELVKAGETLNRVNNSDFEGGWPGGNGSARTSGPAGNRRGVWQHRSLRVRASSQGRYTSPFIASRTTGSRRRSRPCGGETFTIRAKGRWLAAGPTSSSESRATRSRLWAP